MKETNLLINISSILGIISGLSLAYIMLQKGTETFNINCILYFIGMITFVFSILTLFREGRSKK